MGRPSIGFHQFHPSRDIVIKPIKMILLFTTMPTSTRQAIIVIILMGSPLMKKGGIVPVNTMEL
ncbi:MAG TPA: hypothetical protein DDW34_14040 [Clostridium sp.]|nr:hypothetical protein [Clostridium sp.]